MSFIGGDAAHNRVELGDAGTRSRPEERLEDEWLLRVHLNHNARPLERRSGVAFQPLQRLLELVEKPLLDRHKLRRAQRGRAPVELDFDAGHCASDRRAEGGAHCEAAARGRAHEKSLRIGAKPLVPLSLAAVCNVGGSAAGRSGR